MTPTTDYLLFAEAGQVVVPDTLNSKIVSGDSVTVEYTHYPLWESKRLNNEESNPVFDGIKIYVKDKSLALNLGKNKMDRRQPRELPSDRWPIRWQTIQYAAC